MNGIVFDLKRFAVHDGSGIRSTLFLKGCPLHCRWCQNPEGIRPEPELRHNPGKCLSCRTCVRICPEKAVGWNGKISVRQEACTRCGLCVKECPGGAMEIAGRSISAQQAAEELLRDRVFFGKDGGVTLSGGEALYQPEFAREVLSRCKAAGVDTAIETSLFASRRVLERMLPVTDHFLADVKELDRERHFRFTGGSNETILENLEFLLSRRADVLVRTPLIPGYTATEQNVRAIARYLVSLNPEIPYELLNFNPLCRSKYAAMDQDYPVAGGALSEDEMERYRAILKAEGLRRIIKE
jgi:glycyl-radical enzyme activating protein